MIPDQLPSSSDINPSNMNVKQGHGFVVETMDGDWVKGWVAEATDEYLLLDYAPIAGW